MASRGSVVPHFIRQIQAGTPLTVTDPRMTRFMITLEQGVDLVWRAFEDMQGGEIYVRTFQFLGGRTQVKFQATQTALDRVRRFVT